MNKLQLIPLAQTDISGYVGGKLDTVLSARILGEHAADVILAEALEAFRTRVDDRLETDAGLWQGEFWGKWMLSAIAAQQYTGDEALLQTIHASCKELIATQDDNGYIGTYHDSGFVKDIDNNHNWNIWCRKYTLWGLVEAYELLDDEELLNAAVRFMDHLISEVGPDAVPINETGKFYGLPSTSILYPVVRLYVNSREQRFLDYAYYIVSQWSEKPGLPPDIVNKGLSGAPIHEWFEKPEEWTKAYEFISCVEGLVELYKVDKNQDWLNAAINIHKALRKYERRIFGGIGKNDKLLGSRFLGEGEAEVCDAVYWQRLSSQLLSLTGEPVYAEEIERTLYNVLCGAMNGEATWGVRRLLLNGAHWPAPKHCHMEHQHCCVANLPRGLLQAAQTAVMPSEAGAAIVLIIPGEYKFTTPKGQAARLIVKTDYPRTGYAAIGLELAEEENFTLSVRVPLWAEQTQLLVNGKEMPAAAGVFNSAKRTWQDGDSITIQMELTGRIIPLPSLTGEATDRSAVMRGPLVLARDIRLGQDGIHDPVAITAETVELMETEAPQGMWLSYTTGEGIEPEICLCDFSSAGQTWDEATSDFRVWMEKRG